MGVPSVDYLNEIPALSDSFQLSLRFGPVLGGTLARFGGLAGAGWPYRRAIAALSEIR